MRWIRVFPVGWTLWGMEVHLEPICCAESLPGMVDALQGETCQLSELARISGMVRDFPINQGPGELARFVFGKNPSRYHSLDF